MADDREAFDRFMTLSATLTGHAEASLHATGCAQDYWRQLCRVLPHDMVQAIPSVDQGDSDIRMLLSTDDWGPVARNVMQLWYLGIWHPLPERWRRRYGSSPHDVEQVISARAYKEALVWNAIGAHPMGAKQQGFGAWANPPPEAPEI
jgi:hypothetical protein